MGKRRIRIGTGAGWWGDRIEPAAALVTYGELDYLCFETMAEATVSAAQVRARRDRHFPGYDTHLDARMRAVLPGCIARGVKIVSNQGWINPTGAARRIAELLRELGWHGVRIAALEGSVVTDQLHEIGGTVMETGGSTAALQDVVSAEAYLGADGIVEALRGGAQIVVTGRVADPSLFLAPMVHEFSWEAADHSRLGAGAGIGHLMECGAQLTGGYFCDPGFKDLPRPWDLGFPIADVSEDGSAVFSKTPGSGGAVNLQTVREQMLYEVHDPANYITPDVVVDFTTAQLEQVGPDQVLVRGIAGKPRTPTLKVSIGCLEGFIGEDMFFYAGAGCVQRAQLARRILQERFRIVGLQADDIRIDFLGINAVHGEASPTNYPEPYELGVRVATRTRTRAEAEKIGREVDGMAVSGVGHTGKRVPHADRVREVVGVWSTLVPREAFAPKVHFLES